MNTPQLKAEPICYELQVYTFPTTYEREPDMKGTKKVPQVSLVILPKQCIG
jgi:hypothetical protein